MTETLHQHDDALARAGADIDADLEAATREFASSGEQLKEGLDDVSAAAGDAAASIKYAAEDSLSDIAVTLRELVREKPLASIAVAAGAAFVLARLLR